jgi:tetratricopeptide (TPR) repeat protein
VDPFGTYDVYLKCLKELKDYDKAEKLIKKQSKKGAGLGKYTVDLGLLYELQGDKEKAKKQFEVAIKNLLPDLNEIYSIATTFIQNQKTDYAIETFLKGRMLTGGNGFGFDLAELYGQKGDLQKMIDEYLNLMTDNQQFVANVQAILQNKMAQDMEGKISTQLRTSLLRKIQREPNQLVYNDFLYWLFLQDKDFESAFIQAKSMDKKTGDTGARVYALGEICVSNNEWSIAEKCYSYITDKGNTQPLYIQSRIALIKAGYQRIVSKPYSRTDLTALEQRFKEVINELGKNSITAPLIQLYAHFQAFHLHEISAARQTLEETIAIKGVSQQFISECKLELGDIMILDNDLWEASLTYSQVDKDFKNDAIGREAKFRNARLSYYLGEFDWAVAQLNVLKQATSQLISNDAMDLALLISDNVGMDSITEPLRIYSRASLLAFQNKNDEALLALDSILILFPQRSITDAVWFKQADIQLRKNNVDTAIKLYQSIFEKYPDGILADDALYKMGDLFENTIKDKEKAMETYLIFIDKYPSSVFSADVRKRYRQLRGDKIN